MRAPLLQGLLTLLALGPASTPAAIDLASPTFLETGAPQRCLAVADLDGDGRDDLAVVHTGGSLVTLRNLGAGVFAPPVSHGVLWAAAESPIRIEPADVDRDGDPDLLAAVATIYGAVHVVRNRGDGTFDPPVHYDSCYSTQMLVAADLDRDKRLDVAGDSNCFQATVLLNNGDGTFRHNGSYGRGYTPGGIDAGDLDGDGDLDLAYGNGTSDVTVLRNDGTGVFGAHTQHDVDHNPRDLRIADLDGDGDLDIVTANQYTNFLSVLRNDGSGGFPAVPENHVPGFGTSSLALADFDGDGDPDAVVANRNDDHLSILHNPGDGTFVDRRDEPAGAMPLDLAWGDLDGDAFPDVAAAHGEDTRLAVYRNVTPVTPDGDGDRVRDAEDCAPADPTAWRAPGAARDLLLDGSRLSWLPPAQAGAAAPLYDVLRSEDPASFAAAPCVGGAGLGRIRVDTEVPAGLFAYLVRVRHACGGNLGTGSDGIARAGAPCP